jgi:putative Mg2+ transporter-C (MgtC) family protein
VPTFVLNDRSDRQVTMQQFSHAGRSYFTEFTLVKGTFYLLTVAYVFLTCLAVIIQPFVSIPCDLVSEGTSFGNPAFHEDPCRFVRSIRIFYLTVNECDFGRRLVASVIGGGVIGWERRQSDRPAGIRTMSLVSLGSCLFTICSTYAFLDGPMSWDASRVAAAIPSGVGFLGAGLIFKEQKKDAHGEDMHTVRGLTTAASLWLSAAVGIACGGQLYFVASFSIAIILVLLRFGPRVELAANPDYVNTTRDIAELRDPEMQAFLHQAGKPAQYTGQFSSRPSISQQLGGRHATFSAHD